jgi:hypothetical protein
VRGLAPGLAPSLTSSLAPGLTRSLTSSLAPGLAPSLTHTDRSEMPTAVMSTDLRRCLRRCPRLHTRCLKTDGYTPCLIARHAFARARTNEFAQLSHLRNREGVAAGNPERALLGDADVPFSICRPARGLSHDGVLRDNEPANARLAASGVITLSAFSAYRAVGPGRHLPAADPASAARPGCSPDRCIPSARSHAARARR